MNKLANFYNFSLVKKGENQKKKNTESSFMWRWVVYVFIVKSVIKNNVYLTNFSSHAIRVENQPPSFLKTKISSFKH